MLRQVYELNLPPFSEIVKEDFAGFPKNNTSSEYVTGFDKEIGNIIKSEWLTFLGIKWASYRYFKKNSVMGLIHTDIDLVVDDLNNRNNICVWGINWIFAGSGKMEFWNFENVKRVGVTKGSDNLPKFGSVSRYEALKDPDYTYTTLENKVYLINASLPHRAVGMEGRKAFSLRTDTFNDSWNKIVEIFKPVII